MPIADLQEALDLAVHEDIDNTVFFDVSNQFQNAIIEENAQVDLDTVRATQMLAGVCFHQTRHSFNGSPVWKLTEAGDLGQLYMFKASSMGEGQQKASWYISSAVFGTEKELQERQSAKEDPLFVACYAVGDDEFPHQFHLPYWQRKPNDYVTMTSIWAKHLDCIEHNLHLRACLANALDAVHEPTPHEQEEQAADAAGSQQASSWETSSWERSKPPSRGGWLPKMASLIAAIWAKDQEKVDQLTDTYYNSSVILQAEVDKARFPRSHQGCKSKGGKGGKSGKSKGGKGKGSKSDDE